METPDNILDKVRKLLALADHPNTSETESNAFRQKADALMFKYRIEEATLIASGRITTNANVPNWRTVEVANYGSEFSSYYQKIAMVVAQHVGARIKFDYSEGMLTANLCGYTADLMYAEVLMTSCILEFGKRMEPKVDPSLSDAENAYTLRAGGWERKRIARVLFGEWDSENEMKAKNRKVTKLIRQWAVEIGEDPDELLGRGNNIAAYRLSYSHGFVDQIHMRLYRMRTANGEESAGLVLADRSERINEAFYEKYPSMRPSESVQAKCEKCKKAKSGYCREHSYMKPRYRTVRGNAAGNARGRNAALHVDLGPNATGSKKAPTAPTRGSIG